MKRYTPHDVVQRYCPYVHENVVMLKSASDAPETFTCLHARDCEKKDAVACRMTGKTEQL